MMAFTVYLIGFVLVFIVASVYELYELKKDRPTYPPLKELKEKALQTASIAAVLWPVLLTLGVIVLPFTLTFNLLDKMMDRFFAKSRD